MTCNDPAERTILYRGRQCGAAFTSPFAVGAAAMQLALEWATANRPAIHSQSAPTFNRSSRQLNVGLQ